MVQDLLGSGLQKWCQLLKLPQSHDFRQDYREISIAEEQSTHHRSWSRKPFSLFQLSPPFFFTSPIPFFSHTFSLEETLTALTHGKNTASELDDIPRSIYLH